MSPRTWGKVIFGLLVIGGTLGGLWAAFRPSLPGVATEASRPAAVPALRDARAAVILSAARSPRTWRAVIACDGRRRSATGFWARRPAAACDALAATRGALLAGAGCRRTPPGRWRLHVTGSFGGRRVDHRAQHGGCPDPAGWLAVNALVQPVLRPEQELDRGRTPGVEQGATAGARVRTGAQRIGRVLHLSAAVAAALSRATRLADRGLAPAVRSEPGPGCDEHDVAGVVQRPSHGLGSRPVATACKDTAGYSTRASASSMGSSPALT